MLERIERDQGVVLKVYSINVKMLDAKYESISRRCYIKGLSIGVKVLDTKFVYR